MTYSHNHDDIARCQELLGQLNAYVDGELDPAHALEMERQFASDPALAAERDRVEALRRAIREQLPAEAAPASLTRRIESSLDLRREDPRTRPTRHGARSRPRSCSRCSWQAARPGLCCVPIRPIPART